MRVAGVINLATAATIDGYRQGEHNLCMFFTGEGTNIT